VAEVIEKCGHEVYVSNTGKVPYIHQSDAKDDPGDAYKLAELVHFKPRLLHPIQHRSREAQADLSWIRAREVLVESRTQWIHAVRGLSQALAGRLEKCSTESFTAKLAGQVPEAIRGAVAPLLETIDHRNEQIRYYDQMEEQIARERYPKYRALEQVNGVGVHTALSRLCVEKRYLLCLWSYNWSSYCSNATRTNWPRVRTPVFWNRLCRIDLT
jgi:transposase